MFEALREIVSVEDVNEDRERVYISLNLILGNT
jgi:hypothetical protein